VTAGGSFREASFPLHFGNHTAMRCLLPALRRDFPGMRCPILAVCQLFTPMCGLFPAMYRPFCRCVAPFWRCIALFRLCVWNVRRWNAPSIEISETLVELPHTLTENTHTSVECTGYALNVGADLRRNGGPGLNARGSRARGATSVHADGAGPAKPLPLSFPAASTVSGFSSARGAGL